VPESKEAGLKIPVICDEVKRQVSLPGIERENANGLFLNVRLRRN